MPTMDTRTIIWNRAAMAGPPHHRGDAALSAVLRLHSAIMSGGLEHAADVLPPEAFAAAADGFRYLGMTEAADLVAQPELLEEDLDDLDDRYDALIPRDQVIVTHFETLLHQHPDDFAPVDSQRSTDREL